MTDSNLQDGSGGLSRPVSHSIGPFFVDCSQWDSEAAAGKWSTGRFQTGNRSLPAMVCDMSPAGKAYLEISLRLDSDVRPERAFMLATELITSVQHSVPDLALVYDPSHSRSQNGTVIIALVPNTDDPIRLEQVAQSVRQAGNCCDGATLDKVVWSRAA